MQIHHSRKRTPGGRWISFSAPLGDGSRNPLFMVARNWWGVYNFLGSLCNGLMSSQISSWKKKSKKWDKDCYDKLTLICVYPVSMVIMKQTLISMNIIVGWGWGGRARGHWWAHTCTSRQTTCVDMMSGRSIYTTSIVAFRKGFAMQQRKYIN